MPPVDPSTSKEAYALNLEAQRVFLDKDYERALDLFNKAIDLEKRVPELFSSRSATYVELERYDEAYRDARETLKLAPTWSQAHARVAIAQERRHNYQAAFESFRRAADLAPPGIHRNDYDAAAERMEVKLDSPHLFIRAGLEDPRTRLRELEAKGSPCGPETAARRHAYVTTRIMEGWALCQRMTLGTTRSDGTPFPRGQRGFRHIERYYDAFTDLAASMLLDPTNSLLSPKGRLLYPVPANHEWKDPISLVNVMQNVILRQLYHHPKVRNPTASDWIEQVDAGQREFGWDGREGDPIGVRNTLAGAIRIKVIAGIMKEFVAKDYAAAFKLYDEAHEIIVLGRLRWPRQIESDGCGTSMRRTFKRSVYARMLECKLRLAQATGNKPRDLDELEQMAKEQVSSCEKHPAPRPEPDATEVDFAFWLTHDAGIRAEAFFVLGHVHVIRATRSRQTVGQSVYLGKRESELAMENYYQAASWFPPDDRMFAYACWSCLELQMRLGKLSLQAINATIGTNREAEDDYDRYHGPQDRSKLENRAFVLDTVKKLAKKAKQKGITDPAKIVLNAVPIDTLSGTPPPPLLAEKSKKKELTIDRALAEIDLEEDDSRFTMDEAKRVREEAIQKAPAVFVDT